MRYQHRWFAEAEIAWNIGSDPASLHDRATLPPFYGEEGPSREVVISQQKTFIAQWLRETHKLALIEREISALRAEAFAAEGLS